jgi:hypothetical protein
VESGYAPADWVALCAAEVAAAAALTGLVFVSVSINLERIMRYPTLPDRALEAILLFSVVVLTSTLVLVPGQSVAVLGIELLVVTVLGWAAIAYIHIRSLTDPGARGYISQRIAYAALTELAMLGFALSGLTLVLHAGGGLYWLVPATILALSGAVVSERLGAAGRNHPVNGRRQAPTSDSPGTTQPSRPSKRAKPRSMALQARSCSSAFSD